MVQWIETAVGLALSGAVRGLVTAPIAKKALYEAGFGFPGHTEFLGELTAAARYDGARGPVMMLAAAKGSTVVLETDGPDEEAAMAAITGLIASRFEEDE